MIKSKVISKVILIKKITRATKASSIAFSAFSDGFFRSFFALFLLFLFSLLFLFGTIVPNAAAQDEWLYSDSATLSVKVSSSLRSFATANDYLFDGLIVNLSFIPMQTQRQTFQTSYYPKIQASSPDAVQFETTTLGKFDFGYTAKIKTTNFAKKIDRKISFPQKTYPSELNQYLLPSGRIDSDNPLINAASSKLIEGEDDYFVVVNKIASYVNKEVNYNLSTLFIKSSKKASWVLQQKEGVCSEISVLFIAMLRSVGIPARFVSGVSYTNSDLFDYSFGPHAWAEVYFPDIGWVPYDITYGEYGYIDLGHIEMKTSADATETTTTYSWKAKDVMVNADDLKIDGQVLEKSSKKIDDVLINAKPYFSEVGFLSYNVIIAEVINPNNYYVTKKIKIGQTQDLDFFEQEKEVILRPKETKKTYFVVKTPNLDKSYLYSFPITIYTEKNETGKTSFTAGESWKVVPESELIEITSLLDFKEKKNFLKKVAFSCFKRDYYIDEDINLKCEIANEGNTYLENLNICLENNCQEVDLGITQTKKLNYTLRPQKVGLDEVLVNIYNINLQDKDLLDINILDVPKIEITQVNSPENVSFDDYVELSFVMQKTSASAPKRVASQIIIDGDARTTELNDFSSTFKIKTNVLGSELKKKSDVTFRVTYEDSLGRKYTQEKYATITLNKLTFLQQLRVILNDILAFFNGTIDKFKN